MDEMVMRKEGRSAAFKEIMDLLTEMEMEKHRPKPPPEAKPAMGSPGEMPAGPSMDAGAEMPPAEGESGGLSEDEIAELQAKLDEMR